MIEPYCYCCYAVYRNEAHNVVCRKTECRYADCHAGFQVRLSQDTEEFLLNPFGMLYNEITASSLVKVDMQGNVIDGG